MYQTIINLAEKFFSKATIFKYGFNISPMYRRSTGRIVEISEDLHTVKIKIKRSWKNQNYAGSIFGGSLFSATDPIYMIQLVQILGKDFIVWDKSSNIKFKRPAFQDGYATFTYTSDELTLIREKVKSQKEFDYTKPLEIVSEDGTVFCSLEKTIYIAEKKFYKEKLKRRNETRAK